MISSCPICSSNDVKLCDAYRGGNEVFRGLMLAKCSSCGMVFASPMPSNDALAKYNLKYFSSAHGGISKSPETLAFFSAISRLRIAYLERYLDIEQVQISTVLEFGPGPGFFAACWLERYPKTIYQVCETDKSCHDSLKKLGIQVIDFDSHIDAIAQVDLVVMSHVLEHVTSPKEFLEIAKKRLKKNGIIFIEVPCLDFKYKLLDEPHLLFFDKQQMHNLLKLSGFEIIDLSYFGQAINALQSSFSMFTFWIRMRSKLISLGLVLPFALHRSGLETLINSLEVAVIAPFKAHRQSTKPARWLRAIAKKM